MNVGHGTRPSAEPHLSRRY